MTTKSRLERLERDRPQGPAVYVLRLNDGETASEAAHRMRSAGYNVPPYVITIRGTRPASTAEWADRYAPTGRGAQ